MNFISKRTKIITTIGPVSSPYEIMRELALNGMTTIRLNFSHGNRESQLLNIENAKKISLEINQPISIMLDTKGPEIRVGKLENDGVQIYENQLITILTGDEDYKTHVGNAKEFSVSYQMHLDVNEGAKILFDDGKLVTYVQSINSNKIVVKTKNAHFLKTNKRINLPGIDFSLPFLSKKDIDDIVFGIKYGINYIAASFTNSAKDVEQLRKLLRDNNAKHIKIIPKIESVLGVKNIDEIIIAADGIMIARGDLGLEVPFEDVPVIEKYIINKCRKLAKPSIVATQMLDSMERVPIPTRAEVTDVFFAINEGADCTMLSGESASGMFPILSVKTMAKIAKRAEKEFYNNQTYPQRLKLSLENLEDTLHNRVAKKVAQKTMSGDYRFAIVLTKTGETLDSVSRLRPNVAIMGIVSDKSVVSSFGISASVFNPLEGPSLYEEIRKDTKLAYRVLESYSPKKGDKYLVVHRDDVEEFVY